MMNHPSVALDLQCHRQLHWIEQHHLRQLLVHFSKPATMLAKPRRSPAIHVAVYSKLRPLLLVHPVLQFMLDLEIRLALPYACLTLQTQPLKAIGRLVGRGKAPLHHLQCVERREELLLVVDRTECYFFVTSYVTIVVCIMPSKYF